MNLFKKFLTACDADENNCNLIINNYLRIILSLNTGPSIWVLIIGRISESENEDALNVFGGGGGWGLYSEGLNSEFYGVLI